MQSPKLNTRTFDATPQQVFDALLGVVQNGSYTLVALDNTRHMIAFTSGKTALSWGQQYIATMEPASAGTALELMCGGVDGRPKALLDGWKNGKAGAKVVASVASVLDGSMKAPVTPMADFGADESPTP